MNKIHDVQKISFTGTTMKLHIDEKEYEIELGQYSKRLVDAPLNKELPLVFGREAVPTLIPGVFACQTLGTGRK